MIYVNFTNPTKFTNTNCVSGNTPGVIFTDIPIGVSP